MTDSLSWTLLEGLSQSELEKLAPDAPPNSTKLELMEMILNSSLRPDLSLESFRQNLLQFLPQKDVTSLCFAFSGNDTKETAPTICNHSDSWISLLKRDFNIDYEGIDPKKEYAFQYGLSLVKKDPSTEEALWRLIDMTIKPNDYYTVSDEVKKRVGSDIYNLKNALSMEEVNQLNKTYTRLSNQLFLQVAEMDLGSFAKYPDLIYFTDYLMSLGKLHFYLFREDGWKMILDTPLLYVDGKRLQTFPNFFLTRRIPMQ